MGGAMRSNFSTSRGFSLVETLVGAALLVALGGGVYQAFSTIARGAALVRAENAALALASERLEIIRGMDYEEIGVVGGLPAGPIPRRETVDRGILFDVTTTVRSIDLPFDGTINGAPNDTAPADQKLVEVAVTCAACRATSTVSTRIAPASLEI
jgi:type II secretory pathway pseudopilin PulG